MALAMMFLALLSASSLTFCSMRFNIWAASRLLSSSTCASMICLASSLERPAIFSSFSCCSRRVLSTSFCMLSSRDSFSARAFSLFSRFSARLSICSSLWSSLLSNLWSSLRRFLISRSASLRMAKISSLASSRASRFLFSEALSASSMIFLAASSAEDILDSATIFRPR